MIKVENKNSWGFEHAVRGMRNSYDSWDKSDSFYCDYDSNCYCESDPVCERCDFHITANNETRLVNWNTQKPYYVVGLNDLELMQKLIKAGSSHRKFLRQIFVSMDITAPLYWWKEFDTYKVGTTANSCSTMHTIYKKEFTLDDFSVEHLNADVLESPFKSIIDCLNFFRNLYLQNKNKDDWWQMIQLLPSSYNQRRTITMNYENVLNIINQRSDHKLDEWKMFITELKKLPYADKLFISKEE